MDANKPLHILFVEDLPSDVELAERELRHEGLSFTSLRVETKEAYLAALQEFRPDVIISDYALPTFDGMQALKLSLERDPLLPFIVSTGSMNEDTAAACMKAGATDYIIKEHITRLPLAVKGALEQEKIRLEKADADRALRESELKYRMLVKHIPQRIFYKDRESVYISCNDLYAQDLGIQADEIVGKTDFDFHPRELAEKYRAADQRVIDQGEAIETEDEYIVHGEKRISFTIKAPVRDDQGKVMGVLGVYTDITERKRVEQALSESEARFRRLAENAQDMIFRYEYTPRPGFTYVSPASTFITGYTPEEYYADPDLDFKIVHPDDRPLLEAIARGDSTSVALVALRWVHKDGTLVWIEHRNLPIFDEAGNLVAIEGIARNVTERVQAEAALRESEQRFRSLYENSTIGIYRTTPDGRILLANPTLVELWGYSSFEELATRNLEEEGFEPSYDRAQFLETIERDGQVKGLESGWERKDGTQFYIRESARAIRDPQGKTLYYDGIIEDITERKQAEQALRQRLVELQVIQTVSAALRTAQTLNVALPIWLDQTLAALNTDAGAICMYHPSDDSLHTAQARGWFQGFGDSPIKPGQGIIGTVFQSGEAYHSPEFARDPLVRPSRRGQIPSGWGGVCVPIRTAESAIGVLIVSVPPPRQITPEQMQLLASLAEMAGTALHRIRLHEETLRRLDNLQALRSIDEAITSSFDLQVTLNVLLAHLNARLGVDASTVFLLHPHLRTLEYAAGRGFRTRAIERHSIRLGEGYTSRVVLERKTIAIHSLPERSDFHRAALLADEAFKAYYGVPLIAKGQVKGVLEIFHRAPLAPDAEWLNFLETLAGQAAIAIDSAQLFGNLQKVNLELSLAYDDTIEGWSRALDLRDKETEGHTIRVTDTTVRLARVLGVSEDELVHVRRGCLLHDIGKMGVPDDILHKPGPLTDEEWEIMRKHPVYAYEMLSSIVYLHPALDIPYSHHEKWDGSGYPRGLKGEQIPMVARIFAAVDVWDALTSDRPYRKAWTKQEALEYIRQQSGAHFDPRVVDAFLREVTEG
jgi:PAS domain S-box-containing protein/putative nucleotidyltransferase with HDIG domain